MKFTVFLFVSALFAYLTWASHLLFSGVNPFPESLSILAGVIGKVSPLKISILYTIVMFAMFFRSMFFSRKAASPYPEILDQDGATEID